MKFHVKIESYENGQRDSNIKFEQDLTPEEIIELIENYDWSEQIEFFEGYLSSDEIDTVFNLPYPDKIIIGSILEKYSGLGITSIDTNVYTLSMENPKYDMQVYQADFQGIDKLKEIYRCFFRSHKKVMGQILKNMNNKVIGKNRLRINYLFEKETAQEIKEDGFTLLFKYSLPSFLLSIFSILFLTKNENITFFLSIIIFTIVFIIMKFRKS